MATNVDQLGTDGGLDAGDTVRVLGRQFPWLLFGLTYAFAALDLVFLALSWGTPVPNTWGFRGDFAILGIAYAGVGGLLARRRPENPIGWLFLAAGLLAGISRFGIEYSTYVLLTRPGASQGPLPGGVLAAWASSWLWMIVLGILMCSLLLFPTGRLPSRHWKPVAWVAAAAFALAGFELAVRPGPLYFAPYLQNPLAVHGIDGALTERALGLVGLAERGAMLLGMVGVIASVVQRLRRSAGVERQQLKWFTYVAALIGVIGLINVAAGVILGPPRGIGPKPFQLLTVAAEVAIPLTVGLAILRYRLYEIDRVISGTLVYGILSAGVVIAYILIVGLLGSLLNTDVDLAAAILVAVLAAFLFRPSRARLQRFLDRSTAGEQDRSHSDADLSGSEAASEIPLSRWLPWLLFGLTCTLTALDLMFNVLNRSVPLPATLGGSIATLTSPVYAGIGGYLARKRPQNPIGWLFLVFGTLGALGAFGMEYAAYTLLTRPGTLPGGVLVAWVVSWTWLILPGLASGIFFLFPTGSVPSRRWRPFAWATVVAFALGILVQMFLPGPLRASQYLDNPLGGTVSATVLSLAYPMTYIAVALCQLAASACVVARFRAARGVERQQLKWFAYTAALLMVVGILQSAPGYFHLVVPGWWNVFNVLLFAAIVAVPFACASAILRYRLYEIDRLINYTLVYGLLSAGILALYILLVGGLGTLSETSGNLLVSLLATGLIAILFQPLRERLQRGVNHLMYGERDEPFALMARLGQNLETTTATVDLLDTLVRTIAQALKLPYAAIETGRSDGTRIAAASGQRSAETERIPLSYQGEVTGHLLVAPRSPGEKLGPADLNLLRIIAQQAGMAVHAVQLTEDLQHSRERLVVAREEERRRIRRDLHDGLGPALASLAMQADNAREWTRTDPGKADAALAEITTKAQAALQDIRRLVYDLRPPALDELGLVGALRQTAANSPNGLHIEIHAPERLPRLSAAVEVAAYRIAQETLNNVARHSQARNCLLTISVPDALRLEISDDGVGLPPDVRAGVGLISMRERAVELGGACVIESERGQGTRVIATLPLVDSRDEDG